MTSKRTKIDQEGLSAEDQAAVELANQKMLAAQSKSESNYNSKQGRPKITTDDVAANKEQMVDLKPGELDRTDLGDLSVVTGEDLKSPLISEHVKILAFMEEPVTFQVAKTNVIGELDPLDCSVNGDKRLIPRGVPVTLPRKFLNALIGSVSDISTEQYVDGQGLNQTKVKKETAPSCQISVLEDNSKYFDGKQWFSYTQQFGG